MFLRPPRSLLTMASIEATLSPDHQALYTHAATMPEVSSSSFHLSVRWIRQASLSELMTIVL